VDDEFAHILSGDRSSASDAQAQGSVDTKGNQEGAVLTPLIHFVCGNGHVDALRLLIQASNVTSKQ
jgi:hypothetical protein